MLDNPKKDVPSLKRLASLGARLVASGMLLLPGRGNAQITMSDGGSTATINTGNTGTLGMNSWTVLGGWNQLNEEWFWYSVDDGAVEAINTIGGLTVSDNAYGADGLNDVTVTYPNSTLSVSVEYVLSGNGAGSGSAAMTKYISIGNNSGSTINNFSLYEYSNFNLLGNNQNTVTISGSPGNYTGGLQDFGAAFEAATISLPSANYAEAGLAGQTLGDVTSGTLNDNVSAGPGNVAWAFQWNTNLAESAELEIEQDSGLAIELAPEPSTLVLFSLALAGLGLRRKA